MVLVNEILSKCVVEEEDNCLKSAEELLALIDKAMASLRSPGLRPLAGASWPCRVCGKGHCVPQDSPIQVEHPGFSRMDLGFCLCDDVDCRHVELFWKVPAHP